MPTRVLVIDDDAHTRDLVAAILEPADYAVRGAEGGLAGLSLAEADPPDIVLLDVQMPGMDGFKVCRLLRQGARTRQIPVIMLTSSDDRSLNRKAYAAGARACVPKPFRREGLIAAIRSVLAGRPRATGQADG